MAEDVPLLLRIGPAAEPAPARAGRFQLGRLLGRGASSEVREGWDPRARQRAAVKLLARAGDAAARTRLEREARLLARLDHPGVAAWVEAGLRAEPPWLAQEALPGPGLDRVLALLRRASRQGAPEAVLALPEAEGQRELLRLPASPGAWPARWRLLLPALETLAALHRQGWLHLDLKPAHLVLDGLRRPRLTDFGLGCAPGEEAPERPGGTPGYGAPEQFREGPPRPSPASDVHAFARILLDFLVLEEGALPPRRLPRAGRGPGRLLAAALAPDPRRRPADAGALLAEVQDLLDAAGA